VAERVAKSVGTTHPSTGTAPGPSICLRSRTPHLDRLSTPARGPVAGPLVGSQDARCKIRVRQLGVDDPENDPTVLVECLGNGPRLWFQSVPEAKTVKNRLHVDLRSDDVDAELERLRSLGATVPPDQPNDNLIVLVDPEGNEFCLLR
jgi:hypothetical protein